MAEETLSFALVEDESEMKSHPNCLSLSSFWRNGSLMCAHAEAMNKDLESRILEKTLHCRWYGHSGPLMHAACHRELWRTHWKAFADACKPSEPF